MSSAAGRVDETTDATVRVRRWARHHVEVWGASTLVAGWMAGTFATLAAHEPDDGSAAGLLRFAAVVAFGLVGMFAWWTVTTVLIGATIRAGLRDTRCVDGANVPHGRSSLNVVVFADDEHAWFSQWHRRIHRRGRVLVAGRGRFCVAVWPGATRPVLLRRSWTAWGDGRLHRITARAHAVDHIP